MQNCTVLLASLLHSESRRLITASRRNVSVPVFHLVLVPVSSSRASVVKAPTGTNMSHVVGVSKYKIVPCVRKVPLYGLQVGVSES